MAKGKHAAALFEVIHSDKRFGRAGNAGGALRTPNWWFKRRPADASPPPAPTNAAPAAPVAVEPASDAPTAVAVDRDRQQISLRLTYHSAAIAAFAILAVVLVAYLIGKRGNAPSVPMLGRATEELQKAPPQPNTLNVNRAELATPYRRTDAAPASVGATEKRPYAEPKPPSTLVVEDSHRSVGLNYVIIQSYPDEKNAVEARDVLIKNGVLCTAEKAPAGWTMSNWYSVIGIRGFDKIRNSPDFDQYVKQIEAVSSRFAGNSKFKKFEPRAYRWREAR